MKRVVGYRVTWRKSLPSGDREPRQMLYTMAESEHARSYARCAADVMRGVHDISDVRVWRVTRGRDA